MGVDGTIFGDGIVWDKEMGGDGWGWFICFDYVLVFDFMLWVIEFVGRDGLCACCQ